MAVIYASKHTERIELVKKQEENIKCVLQQVVKQKYQARERSVVGKGTLNNDTDAHLLDFTRMYKK